MKQWLLVLVVAVGDGVVEGLVEGEADGEAGVLGEAVVWMGEADKVLSFRSNTHAVPP